MAALTNVSAAESPGRIQAFRSASQHPRLIKPARRPIKQESPAHAAKVARSRFRPARQSLRSGLRELRPSARGMLVEGGSVRGTASHSRLRASLPRQQSRRHRNTTPGSCRRRSRPPRRHKQTPPYHRRPPPRRHIPGSGSDPYRLTERPRSHRRRGSPSRWCTRPHGMPDRSSSPLCPQGYLFA